MSIENKFITDPQDRAVHTGTKGIKILQWNTNTPVAVILFLAGLCYFVPWYPNVATFHFESFMHVAFGMGLQFGTDIISQYGPLSFICLPFYYHPTYLIMILANMILYVFMIICLWQFWRSVVSADGSPAVWITALLILPAFKQPEEWAAALFMPYILINLFTLWHFLTEKPVPALLMIPLAVFLAAFILVKSTFIVPVGIFVAIVSLDQIFKWRRVPWTVFIFVAAVLFFWVVSGQKIANLAGYFASNADFAMGYKDAGSICGRNDWASAPIFVLSAMALTGCLWWALQRRIGWRSVYPTGMLAFTLFITFQHGFVRADKAHTVPAYLTFFILSLLILPLIWKYIHEQRCRYLLRNGIVVILVISLCGMFLGGDPKWKVLYVRPCEFLKLVFQGTASLDHASAANIRKVKADNPLPKLKEPVDCFAVDFGLPAAYGFKFANSPSVLHYTAFTPGLSQKNREYIENKNGPPTILETADASIDGRYPTVTDSLSVLGLKSHFKAVHNTGKILVLERRANPLRMQLVKLEDREIRFDEPVNVPNSTPEIYAQIDIQPTWIGRLVNILYKLPPVFLAVNGGTQRDTFRLTIALAREGMLLSPLLDNLDAFYSFYSTGSSPAGVQVTALRIQCPGALGWLYNQRIKISFYELIAKE